MISLETPEEHGLAELATALVTQYEEEHYPDPKLSPIEMLRKPVELCGLCQVILVPIFRAK